MWVSGRLRKIVFITCWCETMMSDIPLAESSGIIPSGIVPTSVAINDNNINNNNTTVINNNKNNVGNTAGATGMGSNGGESISAAVAKVLQGYDWTLVPVATK